MASAGVCVDVTVRLVGGEVVEPDLAEAMLVMPPASTSACVVVYVAVQTMDAPGARPAPIDGHVTEATLLSATVTADVRVTLPVLVTV